MTTRHRHHDHLRQARDHRSRRLVPLTARPSATPVPTSRCASGQTPRGRPYSPHVDMGDHIVVVNAEDPASRAAKLGDKIYYHHTSAIGIDRSPSTSC